MAGAAASLPVRAEPFAWPGGAKAAVSLTYDDGLDSQVEHAVPALTDAGLKGTFFLTRENMEAKLTDWQAVFRQGHEVGNHSITHPCALAHCTSAAFHRDQVAPMEAFLDQNFSANRFRSYAYPCGYLGLGRGDLRQRIGRYQSALRGEVAAARTVSGLPNDPRRVAADPFMLHAFEPTWSIDSPWWAYHYVNQAIRSGDWAILVFHDVYPERMGAGDTSQRVHTAILAWLKEQPVWCAPLGEVFQYCASGAKT